MSDSMKIVSSKKRIAINDDENRIVEINPGSVTERKKFYETSKRLEQRAKELKEEEQKLIAENNELKMLELSEKTFDEMSKEVDFLFGEGTAQKITQGEKELDMLVQFFEGLSPYFEEYNNRMTNRYSKTSKSRKNKSGVMK